MTEHDPPDRAEPDHPSADRGLPAASVHDGVQHLQRAAQESIAAVRALLDVVEELVADPRTVDTLLSGLSSLTDITKSGIVDKHRSPPRDPAGGDDDGGVQRIPVS